MGKHLKIPMDPHDLRGAPQVTTEMKAKCLGEFSFTIERYCSVCAVNGAEDDCEVCHGELEYTETVTVPWGTCKEIFKEMALAASDSE